MDTSTLERLAAACERFPKSASFKPTYGTAGFRAEGGLLHSTLFRCGILMALRSVKTGGTTGIVVTASHNPAQDNGVKLVEPTGYMLLQSWEAHADELALAEDCNMVTAAVKNLCSKESIICGGGRVMIGYDTRPTSPELVDAAKAGVEAAGGSPEPVGLLTTPQLHWMVRQRNQGASFSEVDYFQSLGDAFCRLVSGVKRDTTPLFVDCANGVGAQKLLTFQQYCPALRLELRNTGQGVLNGDCGADAVQKGSPEAGSGLPLGFGNVPLEARCASIDGDADRLVYFTHIGAKFVLLDGDRIAALAAVFVQRLVAALKSQRTVSVGVVQTAYANGSSTQYMKSELGLDVRLAKTGVKHLHHLAESFDVGIYFEANGHGTILFKDSLLECLEKDAQEDEAASDLVSVARMVNQAIGDAISGILLVEAALQRLQWSLKDLAGLYSDLPSCMLKVKVPDRGVFTTTEAETRTVTPSNLQPRIDALVDKVPKGRCFVRPSGTENVVRVYAEAGTLELAAELGRVVAEYVEQEAASEAG